MKKLLGIVVLGLGLVVSVNANAKENSYCVTKKANSSFGHVITKINKNSICNEIIVREKENPAFHSFIQSRDSGAGAFFVKRYLISSYLTQIAKKEPKQKEKKVKVAKITQEDSKAEKAKIEKEKKKISKEKRKIENELKIEKIKLAKVKEELKKVKKTRKNLQNTDIVSIKTDEKYYALLIGNDDYKFWGKLEASVNDVKAVSNIISKKYGFETETLINATSEEIMNKLFEYTEKIKEQDNLLIYYAGHGDLNTNMSPPRAYWIPIDGGKKIDRKWINTQDVSAIVSLIKAKHILIMVDSCYAGSSMRGNVESSVTTNDQIKDKKYIEKLLMRKTRLLITSGGIEPVVDVSVENHSLFAYKLLDILKENDGYITGSMVWSELNKYHGTANQNPEIRWLKEMGDLGGDFVFIAQN